MKRRLERSGGVGREQGGFAALGSGRRGVVFASVVALGLAWLSLSALAQDKAVESAVISGGGGSSSGSRFQVTGTIGQVDASVSRMAGTRFGVQGGFHALIAIQTPGAPELSIRVSGGQVVVSWPDEVEGWILQESGKVGPAAAWSSSIGVTDNRLTLGLPTGNRFYRLQRSAP